jgi:hypothetical protein
MDQNLASLHCCEKDHETQIGCSHATFIVAPRPTHAMIIRPLLIVALLLAPAFSHADVLKCKIGGFKEAIFITTAPDANLSDSKHALIGNAPGVGNRAILVKDYEDATPWVELNPEGAPISMLRVQKDLRVVKTYHTIGFIIVPSKSGGVCVKCAGTKGCPP